MCSSSMRVELPLGVRRWSVGGKCIGLLPVGLHGTCALVMQSNPGAIYWATLLHGQRKGMLARPQ